MSAKLCSISELAHEIPGLAASGEGRLTALRKAVGDRGAPAALGVRRRPVSRREKPSVITTIPEPRHPEPVRLSPQEAKALPLGCRYFDRAWYMKTYVDVRQSNMDPSLHFRKIGWKEGRNPNPYFDIRDYLAANPDVEAAGINPFEHFVFYGSADRRRLKPE